MNTKILIENTNPQISGGPQALATVEKRYLAPLLPWREESSTALQLQLLNFNFNFGQIVQSSGQPHDTYSQSSNCASTKKKGIWPNEIISFLVQSQIASSVNTVFHSNCRYLHILIIIGRLLPSMSSSSLLLPGLLFCALLLRLSKWSAVSGQL